MIVDGVEVEITKNTEDDFFYTDAEVYQFFKREDLRDMGYNNTLDDLKSDLEGLGHYNCFTDADLKRIMAIAQDVLFHP